MFLQFLGKYKDFGLLLVRIGIGFMYAYVHGFGKMFGGPDRWEKIGGAMANLGITQFPVFWGFMAAFSEFAGGILLIIGLLTRPSCVLLIITMIVATIGHIQDGDGLKGAAHAIENAVFLLGLLFVGPGKFSIDGMLKKA